MTSASSSLLKDHEQFKKRQADAAALLASAEKRQKVHRPSSQKPNRPKSGVSRSKNVSDYTNDFHKSKDPSAISRDYKCANIYDKLKERFLGGQTDPVTLDEIISEAEIQVDSHDRDWLANQGLPSTGRIDIKRIENETKYVYKPPLNLKGRRANHLLNFLRAKHEKCEGTVTVEDVRDTIPKSKADKIIDGLIESQDVVKETNNKKEILFYTDRPYNLHVHPNFIEAWRKISVEGLDDSKISSFLDKEGHVGLMKDAPRHMLPTKTKQRGRRANTMKHNVHVADQLMNFGELPTGTK